MKPFRQVLGNFSRKGKSTTPCKGLQSTKGARENELAMKLQESKLLSWIKKVSKSKGREKLACFNVVQGGGESPFPHSFQGHIFMVENSLKVSAFGG